MRGSLVAFLLVLLCSTAACGRGGFIVAGGGAGLRSHQDLYLDPNRSIRVVETPARSFAAQRLLSGFSNRLVSSDGNLDVNVGVYADCSGKSPIDAHRADVDTCFSDRTYFVGHNPGAFSPLLQMGVGSVLTWHDGAGAAHPLRIVSVRDIRRDIPALLLSQPDVVAEFQTCLTLDGSLVRILDAVAL